MEAIALYTCLYMGLILVYRSNPHINFYHSTTTSKMEELRHPDETSPPTAPTDFTLRLPAELKCMICIKVSLS